MRKEIQIPSGKEISPDDLSGLRRECSAAESGNTLIIETKDADGITDGIRGWMKDVLCLELAE